MCKVQKTTSSSLNGVNVKFQEFLRQMALALEGNKSRITKVVIDGLEYDVEIVGLCSGSQNGEKILVIEVKKV